MGIYMILIHFFDILPLSFITFPIAKIKFKKNRLFYDNQIRFCSKFFFTVHFDHFCHFLRIDYVPPFPPGFKCDLYTELNKTPEEFVCYGVLCENKKYTEWVYE